jgi:uncharacterized NAD(P)/FAD-binding protein YdhS
MTPGERYDVAIVGGGFSGAVLAARLAVDKNGPPLKILLIDRTGRFGRGVAYGTTNPRHLLNVSAGQMSAYAESPNHFVNWAKLRVHGIDAGSYIGRSLYGDYVASVLDDAIRKRAPRSSVEERVASARRIEAAADKAGIHRIHLEDGDVSARLVVLATGNAPPQPIGIPGFGAGADPRHVVDPWAPRALEPLIGAGTVLVVGTGLTMIDIVFELVARGHRGPILAISRRGLLPQPHLTAPPPATHFLDQRALSGTAGARRLVRVVTTAVLRAIKSEGDWRSVIGELRAHTPRIWSELREAGQASFLRHVAPYWETHRHRAPPAVDDALLGLLASGQLHVRAGRLGAVTSAGKEFAIPFEPRDGSDPEVLTVSGIVNCAGPDADVTRSRDALIASMLAAGLIAPGPQSLGIDVDDTGAVIGRDGAPSPFLFAIGPLRRGRLFETTAVPEIRVQAADMVHRLREAAEG